MLHFFVFTQLFRLKPASNFAKVSLSFYHDKAGIPRISKAGIKTMHLQYLRNFVVFLIAKPHH